MPDPAPARPAHLPALDAVRAVTVVVVVAVHATSLVAGDRPVAGAVEVLLHPCRDVFVLLSAAVLTWRSGGRPPVARRLWAQRVPLVLVPYLAWSAVYLAVDGPHGGAAATAAHDAVALVSGGASYHLYFLLLTLQLYVVLPAVTGWLVARAARPWALLAGSTAAQVGLEALVRWHVATPAPLSWLVAHPGSWLAAYQLPVVAGVVAGARLDRVAAWCAWRAWPLACAAAVAAASLGAYAAQLGAGDPVRVASGVWQPLHPLLTLAVVAAGLGTAQRRFGDPSALTRRRLAAATDLSFGVYLAHPLLLAVVVPRVAPVLAGWPDALATAATVVVLAPAVACVSAVGVRALRSTPLSLPLTGRPARPGSMVACPATVPSSSSTCSATSARAAASPSPAVAGSPPP